MRDPGTSAISHSFVRNLTPFDYKVDKFRLDVLLGPTTILTKKTLKNQGNSD